MLGLAVVAVVHHASQIHLPTICTPPTHSARFAAWEAGSDHVHHLVTIAKLLGLAGGAVAALGLILSRGRVIIFLYLAPYLCTVTLSILVGSGLAQYAAGCA
jgi:hypothetical protein